MTSVDTRRKRSAPSRSAATTTSSTRYPPEVLARSRPRTCAFAPSPHLGRTQRRVGEPRSNSASTPETPARPLAPTAGRGHRSADGRIVFASQFPLPPEILPSSHPARLPGAFAGSSVQFPSGVDPARPSFQRPPNSRPRPTIDRVVPREQNAPPGPPPLRSASRRQSEVLYWIAQGKTNIEIGIILDASARTIRAHRRIFRASASKTAPAPWSSRPTSSAPVDRRSVAKKLKGSGLKSAARLVYHMRRIG